MADFEVFDHTADVGILAHGRTLEEVFANAARGMFSLITDLEQIGKVETRQVEVQAVDRDLLLAAWLSELLFLFEVEYLLFGRFQVEFPSPGWLRGLAWGEKIDRQRHSLRMGIKAVTHHMLQVEEVEDGYQARVIFDI